LAAGIPFGAPVFGDRETKAGWMYFLAHELGKVRCERWWEIIQLTFWRLSWLVPFWQRPSWLVLF
jgi:hypothetical protein